MHGPSWISQAAEACDCPPTRCHEKACRGPSEWGTQRRGSPSSLSPKLLLPSPDTRQAPPGVADASPALSPPLLVVPFSDKVHLSVIPMHRLSPSKSARNPHRAVSPNVHPPTPPPSHFQPCLNLHLVLDTQTAFSRNGDQGPCDLREHTLPEIPNGGHV